MANTIILKNSGTATSVPSTLVHGEIALNYADGKLFYKNSLNSIVAIKLVSNIIGTNNQIDVSESDGVFTLSLPSSVYVDSLFINNIEIDTSGATPNQVLKFDGTKFSPAPDAPSNFDDISDVVITYPINGQLLEFDGANWVNDTRPSNEPIGHENIAESVVSFDESTRTFSISPVEGSFTVWCAGKRYVKTSTESVTIPNTSGLYYIYFGSSGALLYKTTFFTWDLDTPTAYVYWNATHNKAYFFADERHGVTLDWATHEYLHRTRGAVIASGFGVNNYNITGDGSSDAHAQLDLANGTFFDEDLEVEITHSSTPTANTWEQVLESGAEIPVFYLSGTEWIRDNPTKFPLKQGTLRARYNFRTNGSWSTADLGNNKFGISWIVATNNLNYPILSILGQNQYDNIGQAEAVDWSDLDLTNFPVVEFRVLYKIIYQTATAYSNTPHARFVGITDLRRVSSNGSGIPSTPVNDHGSLTGLADDDHAQYLHVSQYRGEISAAINTSSYISANSIVINNTSTIYSFYGVYTTVTANQTLDVPVPARSIKYLIHAETDTESEVTELLAVRKLSTVNYIEYGKVSSGSNDLASYNIIDNGSTILLTVTPHYINMTFRVVKTIIS